MKVIEANDFKREFPESFTWGHVDNNKLSSLGSIISEHIKHDIKTAGRNLVPGLRQSLILIAELAEL